MTTELRPDRTEAMEAGERLDGKVALVTGGTRGIGAAISHSLANAGAVVAAGFSRNQEAADAFAAAMKDVGTDISLHQGNVGDYDDCQRVVREVIEQHGRIDILVNNAGLNVDRTISKMTVEDWHKVLRVDLSGAFYMTKPTLEHMMERGSGRIINISSVIGETGNIGQVNYAAAKAGLIGFTMALAREVAFMLGRTGKLSEDSSNITVNVVTPGLIETAMTAGMPEKVLSGLTQQIPLRRLGYPEEVARVVRFIAADSSAYITGEVWRINGGYYM
jgi:acetoacetyl-CoA reductase/3-oxoacyl-[acyl-carrier protein] reductase